MTKFCLWSLVSPAVYFDKGEEFNGPSHDREEQQKQTRSKHTERTANIVGKKEEAEHAPLLGNGPVQKRHESQQSKGFSWRAENHVGGVTPGTDPHQGCQHAPEVGPKALGVWVMNSQAHSRCGYLQAQAPS